MGYNVWDTIARLTYIRDCVASITNKSMGYNDCIPSGILDSVTMNRLDFASTSLSSLNPSTSTSSSYLRESTICPSRIHTITSIIKAVALLISSP
jgi:hypothetical protein